MNKESWEIIRMLNSGLQAFTDDKTDYYPKPLRKEIDALNAVAYPAVNNGVYRAGFASTQDACAGAFAKLDQVEERLAARRHPLGDQLTEADWRLFSTMVRFDVAYYGAVKCEVRPVVDYPNLWDYTRELCQMPGIVETVDIEIFKQGNYSASPMRNPLGIGPKGPIIDFSVAHTRGRLQASA